MASSPKNSLSKRLLFSAIKSCWSFIRQFVPYAFWALAAIAAIYGFSLTIPESRETRPGPFELVLVLGKLPLLWSFYALIAGFFAAWGYQRWRLRQNIRREFASKRRSVSTSTVDNLQWWIAEGLRRRSSDLHTRADFLLAGILVLLFGGAYLVLFVIGQTPEIDRTLSEEHKRVAQRREFQRDYAHMLDSLVEGTHWMRMDPTRDSLRRFRFSRYRHGDFRFESDVTPTIWTLTKDGWVKLRTDEVFSGIDFREGIHQVGTSSNGRTAILVRRDGKAFTLTDFGQSKASEEDFGTDSPRLGIGVVSVSPNGDSLLVGGRRQPVVFQKTASGTKWDRLDLDFGDRESISVLAIGGKGKAAIVAGDEGTIHVKTPSEVWKQPDDVEFSTGDYIVSAAFSDSGRPGVVGSRYGKVFVSNDSGDSWQELDLEEIENDGIEHVYLSADGTSGVLLNGDGMAYHMHAGEWDTRPVFPKRRSSYGPTERAAISTSGDRIILVHRRGFVTTLEYSGDKKNIRQVSSALRLKERESISAAAVSGDGSKGLITGSYGSVFSPSENWSTWEPVELDLVPGEHIFRAGMDKHGEKGMLVGLESSFFWKHNDAEEWQQASFRFDYNERLHVAIPSSDGSVLLVAGDEGSVFLGTDFGKTWGSLDLGLDDDETVFHGALTTDGRGGVLVGDRRSAFWTDNVRQSDWKPTSGLPSTVFPTIRDYRGPLREAGVAFEQTESGQRFVLSVGSEDYVLQPYGHLDGWREMSLRELQDVLKDDDILVTSEIFRELARVDIVDEVETRTDEEGHLSRPSMESALTAHVIRDYKTTLLRIATLTVLFFLAHVLSRLHRYTLRLAAFCDSRADAVLLYSRLADQKSRRFEDLVGALAPDEYDFKASQRSPPRRVGKWFRRR